VYARKLKVDVVIEGKRRTAPLEWLDSFCMRNFTGSAEFDDTLPTGQGRLEAGLRVEPERLAQAMSEWLTKRGKGNGKRVKVEIQEISHKGGEKTEKKTDEKAEKEAQTGGT
jgi:hypothetical protein